MEQYRIGTISKVMRIPIDTLRFHESTGLIHPKKDPNNGYRYYDVTDVSNLLEYQRHRKMDMHGKDVVEIIQKCRLSDYVSRMEEKQKALTAQQEHYSRLREYQTDLVERLRAIGRDLYRFRIVTTSEFYYFNNRTEREFAPLDDLEPLMEEWLQYAPFAEQFCCIKLEDLEEGKQLSYRYGMSIAKKWVAPLGVNTTAEHIHYVPSQMAARVVVGMRGSSIERTPLLEGLQYIRDHRFVPNGHIMGNILARVHDEDDQMIQYVELFFPIRE